MMVHFRKRISLEMIGEVNESLVEGLRSNDNPPSDDESPGGNLSAVTEKPATEGSASTKNTDNKGRLILDATCTRLTLHTRQIQNFSMRHVKKVKHLLMFSTRNVPKQR